MKSKKRKKPKFAQSKKRPKRLSKARTRSKTTFVAAAARSLRLQMDQAWKAGVTFNLKLIMRHAALVNEFTLPDEAEPAPVFRA
jgi:Protein of unknown function (DUF4089)